MPKSKSTRIEYVMYMKKRTAWYVRMKESREFVRCVIKSKNPDGTLHIDVAPANQYNLWSIGADDIYSEREVLEIMRKERLREGDTK